MNPKISVIIPVYNAEEYLDVCINSILNQTYQNLEIILVDDGSTDDSLKICNSLAAKDSRIVVVHKENGGSSSARNLGLDVCTGSLIAFVDSDDSISEDYLSILYDALVSAEADISVCGYKKENDNCLCFGENEIEEFSVTQIPEQVLCKRSMGLAPWGKLIKREVVGDLRFLVGRTNEDDLYCLQLFEKVNKIVKINQPLYNYTVNNVGVTYNTFSSRKIDILPISYEKLKVVERAWPEYLEVAMYSAACSFIDIHIEYARRKLHNDAAFKDKLLRDREDLYNYFVSHTDKQSDLINKKVKFYYNNLGRIMMCDHIRYFRYDIKKFIRTVVKGR